MVGIGDVIMSVRALLLKLSIIAARACSFGCLFCLALGEELLNSAGHLRRVWMIRSGGVGERC